MAMKCMKPEYTELCFNSINDCTGHLLSIPIFFFLASCLTFRKTSFRYRFGGETFSNSKSDTYFLLQLQAKSFSNSLPIALRFSPFNGRFVVCLVSSPIVFFVSTDISNGSSSFGLKSLQP